MVRRVETPKIDFRVQDVFGNDVDSFQVKLTNIVILKCRLNKIFVDLAVWNYSSISDVSPILDV